MLFGLPGTSPLKFASLVLLVVSSVTAQAELEPEEEFIDPSAGGGYELLFLGNSHSASNGLPALVTTMINQGHARGYAGWQLAPGYRFLAERLDDGVTLPLLTGHQWTHVILQAQKYSSSGLYEYPTAAAEEFIRRARSQGARPVLFPEWPRRGNTEEGQRVHDLHLDIASREPACVAPVGLAWEASLTSLPSLELHAPDGNHSNLAGAVLTAYVLYEVITGQTAADLPEIPALGVGPDVQQHLKTMASTVVAREASGCELAGPAGDTHFRGIPALSPLGLSVLMVVLAAVARPYLSRIRKRA